MWAVTAPRSVPWVERDSLRELRRRRALTDDAARPEAVAKRHASGGRTARENLADLVDAGSFVEYGRLVTAAQEKITPVEDLMARTPADGLIGGLARIDGRQCAVLTYDYLVMAGTQGMRGHHKSDRLLELIGRLRLPTVFLAEGGGGRPNDTDYPVVSALDVRSFALWARLSGVAPRIAVVHGPCFAGNAIIAGCADLIVATASSTLGVAGPVMLAAGGLGEHRADELGPVAVMAPNGVVDAVVADEAEGIALARRLLGFFGPPLEAGTAPDQSALRDVIPENERTAFDVRPVISTLCDEGSVVFLREQFAPELVTAFGRIEGRAVGFVANQTLRMAGALTSPASDKAARFLQLCDAFGVPVVSLVDTPGIMGGPAAEASGVVRHASRVLIAAARLQVPLIGVVLRRGYGLGAQAMLGGSTKEPLLTVAWPSAHMGPMGLEGAVRLGLRRQLADLPDDAAREALVRETTAAYQQHVAAFNVARVFEIDDVIDPAETRTVIATTLAAAAGREGFSGSGRVVDAW
ncbi:MAG: acyl-CoA carboxylase subunit beta [Jatrophihabitans sp.]|uniref:acyl-CoA carboxylase subunit beta n=1 Tax=Jatrophihabitans sp. TaxID=1932789 RepID=UPI003F7EBC9C